MKYVISEEMVKELEQLAMQSKTEDQFYEAWCNAAERGNVDDSMNRAGELLLANSARDNLTHIRQEL